jgi:hypothetical protein
MKNFFTMRDSINAVFDLLELVVARLDHLTVQLTLLALLIVGAYTLIKGHLRRPGKVRPNPLPGAPNEHPIEGSASGGHRP